MCFGDLLSAEFQKLTRNCFFKETDLFTKLQDSFINLADTTTCKYKTEIIHGHKSLVDFVNISSFTTSVGKGTAVRRELADMLFIVFSRKQKGQIRLMYLQNKRGLSSRKFYAELMQLHLLKDRCVLTSHELPTCTFGNKNILKSALLPSVGAYGIFYQEHKGSPIEMAYYPANNVEVLNKNRRSNTRMVRYMSNFGQIDLINSFKESQGEKDLKSFGESLVQMKIGTPIPHGDIAYKQIIAFLIEKSEVFRNSGFINPEEYIDNPHENQYIEFGGVSVTCVINADAFETLN